jgi:hypothetical protein
MGIITDVIKCIVNFKFYKTAAQRGVGRAWMHLLLITVLYSIAFTMFANIQFLGQGNRFMDWAQGNLPTLMMQGRTMTTDAQEPFFTSYDGFGLNFVFSTKQEFGDLSSLTPNTVVVEGNRLLFIGDNNTYEEYLFSSMTELPENINIAIDSAGWGRIKAVLNKWFSPVVLLFVFIFTFFTYFIAATVYALIGLIVAMIVKTKLSFGALLAIAIYAMTLLNLVIIVGFFIPFLVFPFRGLILFFITVFYVVAGVIVNRSETKSAT